MGIERGRTWRKGQLRELGYNWARGEGNGSGCEEKGGDSIGWIGPGDGRVGDSTGTRVNRTRLRGGG